MTDFLKYDESVIGLFYRLANNNRVFPQGWHGADLQTFIKDVLYSQNVENSHKAKVIDYITEMKLSNLCDDLIALRNLHRFAEKRDIEYCADLNRAIYMLTEDQSVKKYEIDVLSQGLQKYGLGDIQIALRTLQYIGDTGDISIVLRYIGERVTNWAWTALRSIGIRENKSRLNLTFAGDALDLKAYLCSSLSPCSYTEIKKIHDIYKMEWFNKEFELVCELIDSSDEEIRILSMLCINNIPYNNPEYKKLLAQKLKNRKEHTITVNEDFAIKLCASECNMKI